MRSVQEIFKPVSTKIHAAALNILQRQEAAKEARLLLDDGQSIFADLAAAIRDIDGEDAIRVDYSIDDVEDGDSIDSVEFIYLGDVYDSGYFSD